MDEMMPIVFKPVKPTVFNDPIDNARMGKPLGRRRDAPTREALRFKWLIEQVKTLHGYSDQRLKEITGIEKSAFSKIRNLETNGRGEIGASIIRMVRDTLKVDTAYFYDDYEGPKDHRLYPLTAVRDEKRVSAIETKQNDNTLAIRDIQVLLAQQRRDFEQIKQLLEVVVKGGANVNRKRKPG